MIVYAVTATLPPGLEAAWLAWLLGGHVQAVLAGGACRATVTRLEGEPCRVETRYLFETAEDFARYEAEAAPALRAEGKALFVDPHGVQLTRTLGTQVAELGGEGQGG